MDLEGLRGKKKGVEGREGKGRHKQIIATAQGSC